MKPNKKKKFDIKGFFVQHIEKILLVLILPAAGFIAYQGTTFKLLSWQPDELKRAADNAENHIKTNEQRAADEKVELIYYNDKATWIKIGVQEPLYKTPIPWQPSLFPQKFPRGTVELFPVVDLKVASGLGSVPVNAPMEVLQTIRPDLYEKARAGAPGASGTRTGLRTGERWAVITGLIPIQRQLEVYVNAFSDSIAPNPIQDRPLYYNYEVQRAKVVPGRGIDSLEWEDVDIADQMKQKSALWGGAIGTDPVDPTYMAPLAGEGSLPMSYFLPPVDRKFGEEVAHPPIVPLLTDSQTELLRQMEDLQKQMIQDYFKTDNTPPSGTFNPFSRQGTSGGSATGLGRGSVRPGGRRGEETKNTLDPIVVTDYLYRFLDFGVEPGETYRYRVRLGVANPNYGLLPTAVTDESLTKEPVLYTEFSEPSNMVTIPMDSRVLMTKVATPADKTAEPVASLLAVYFDMADGSEWYVAQDRILRGTTANFKNRELVNPESEKTAATASAGSSAGTTTTSAAARRRTPAATAEKDELKRREDLVSDVCVLDMLGGRTLGKVDRKAPDLRSPAKVLVLEPSGSLVIRNINTDLAEEDKVKNPTSGSGSGRNRGGMSGFGEY